MQLGYSNYNLMTPTAIALGNFDGIHLGHQDVLGPILTYPHSYPTVVTFTPHPREFFTGEKQKLLTPGSEKIEQLKQLGIAQVILLPFDHQLAALSWQVFVKEILLEKLQAKCISVGENFCFGYQRQGTVKDLERLSNEYGVEVVVVKLKKDTEAERISSSGIRQNLAQGNLILANQMLGRSYSLTGQVVLGKQLGRRLGFPTANLEVPAEKLLPRFGVYSVRVFLRGGSAIGVMNIGTRPTLKGQNETIEVHILDWDSNIYGETITVSLEQFIRPERSFNSLTDLKAQIEQDCQKARELLSLVY